MPTVQNVIDGGVAYSTLNDTTLAVDSELIGVIDRAQKELMARHSSRFITKTTVSAPGAGTAWTAPVTSKIHRIEKADGTKVHVVDVDDQEAAFDPRVYRLTDAVYTVGSNPNPASEALVFIHATVPATLSATGSNLQGSWPEWWTRILELEVALFLAVKDGRASEAQLIQVELNSKKAEFDMDMAEDQTTEEHRYTEPG